MPHHSDSIRLRKLLENESITYFERLPKGERISRQALFWADSSFIPLKFIFWNNTSKLVQAAFLKAMYHMEEDVGCSLFQQVSPLNTNIQLGLGEFESDNWSINDEFLSEGSSISFKPDDESDMGYCEIRWQESGQVVSAEAGVEKTLAFPDMWMIAAHELGHALLLGHDPDVPSRLMFKNHTGVGRLKPLERKWVKQIHGLASK